MESKANNRDRLDCSSSSSSSSQSICGQGMVELVGFIESVDYVNEYWDSDEYDDDDDVGYTRQPIEDEAWFLAHEIDYPSDNEKGTGLASVPDPQERSQTKDEDDDQSFAEKSYFSGEHYIQAKNVEHFAAADDSIGLSGTGISRLDDICIDDDQHGSIRSIGVGINSDSAVIGSEVRESLIGGSIEGDFEYFHDLDIAIGGSRLSHNETDRKNIDKAVGDKGKTVKNDTNNYVTGNDKGPTCQLKNLTDRVFFFSTTPKMGSWCLQVLVNLYGQITAMLLVTNMTV
ncbi:hypothetical protein F3Y22_tig00015426pilonHSYRG00166 [Hibiscus syriacus]|uniref:Uncharacterized protein n=1 Tax=Hibiscus syriacus TaxID=106335 RepID=A0A6A3C0X3_HIBSY|nr:hypothetical protein F3Y22_tig00015426pilonHSYRG00166 [Hibiscus syriacus]